MSPELVQWASELLTAPKDRFLADICSSDKAELLLSMNLSDVTEVYGETKRNMKLWIKGLCTMGSTVSHGESNGQVNCSLHQRTGF